MTEQHTLADRLRARAHQFGLTPAQVVEMAGVNRSFVYDILRGRYARPGIDRLAEIDPSAVVLDGAASRITSGHQGIAPSGALSEVSHHAPAFWTSCDGDGPFVGKTVPGTVS